MELHRRITEKCGKLSTFDLGVVFGSGRALPIKELDSSADGGLYSSAGIVAVGDVTISVSVNGSKEESEAAVRDLSAIMERRLATSIPETK